MSAPDTSEAEHIAGCFVAARRTASLLSRYPGALPATLDAAYAIQDAALAHIALPVAGWKVGRIVHPYSEELGVNRFAGPIFRGQLNEAAPDVVGRIFSGSFGAAEAEFVFRIGRRPEPGTSELSLEQTAELVDAVFVGIEIASSPFPGINAFGPFVTISDFGNNNGLILGAEISEWRNAGLEDWRVTIKIDGIERGSGSASSFTDGPLGSVRFLLQNLSARGIGIEPGLLVSTGAVTGIHEVVAGQRVEARFGGSHSISCRIE